MTDEKQKTSLTDYIAAIIALLPSSMQSAGTSLAEIYADMTITELKDLWSLWSAGDAYAALKASLVAMTPDEQDAFADAFTALDAEHAKANAASVEAQKTAWTTFAQAIISYLLACL
jgi:hypothetical protein